MTQTELSFANRESRKPTQEQQVYEYMKEHGSITPLDAMLDIGCMRLASRIHSLRRDYTIETDMVTVKNRHGKDCSVASYRLV